MQPNVQPSHSSDPVADFQQPDEHSLRLKTAMILWELEQSLGMYVTEAYDSPDEMPVPAETRRSATTTSDVVQATYLGPLIDIALEHSKGSSHEPLLKNLKTLMETLGLFSVRNAVCHPNNVFLETYWHRAAAIATDPLLQQLGLAKVAHAYKQAQAGRLTPPPDEFFDAHNWAITNNLSLDLDHQLTGLIGRKSELRDLTTLLRKPRCPLVAISGPGGTGKTAMCLEFLHNTANDIDAVSWLDRIIYVTAKTEMLTTSGVDQVPDANHTLEDIKAAILEALDLELADGSSDQLGLTIDSGPAERVLLCIDNLETIIMEHSEAFAEFHLELPQSWKVLVTSRVPVDSARMFPLGSLQPQGAELLARQYHRAVGGKQLTPDQYKEVADNSNCNPLAIRLLIDSYIAGATLDDAASATNQKIVEYSYSALLDALPDHSGACLECLFAIGEDYTSRRDIVSLLAIPIEDVAVALGALARTSLISRKSGETEEAYCLTSAVRELLLRQPKDIETRDAVYQRLKSQTQVAGQVRRGEVANRLDPCRMDFIRDDCTNDVKEAAAQIIKKLSRQSTVRADAVLDVVRGALQRHQDDPIFHRLHGEVLTRMHDRYGARTAWEKACALERGDSAAKLSLADMHLHGQELQSAKTLSQDLINDGYGEPGNSSEKSARQIWDIRLKSAIWVGDADEALSLTKNWDDQPELMGVLGRNRVEALKRKHETFSHADSFWPAATEMLQILDQLFRTSGYPGPCAHTAFKVCNDIALFHNRVGLKERACFTVCSWIDDHLLKIVAIDKNLNLESDEVRTVVHTCLQMDCGGNGNPLSTDSWNDIATGQGDEQLRNRGYIRVQVYAPAQDTRGNPRAYLFAKDDAQQQYFINWNCAAMDRSDFQNLQTGAILQIRVDPEAEPKEGTTAIAAIEALLL